MKLVVLSRRTAEEEVVAMAGDFISVRDSSVLCDVTVVYDTNTDFAIVIWPTEAHTVW